MVVLVNPHRTALQAFLNTLRKQPVEKREQDIGTMHRPSLR
jgi:hypothetical protein